MNQVLLTNNDASVVLDASVGKREHTHSHLSGFLSGFRLLHFWFLWLFGLFGLLAFWLFVFFGLFSFWLLVLLWFLALWLFVLLWLIGLKSVLI